MSLSAASLPGAPAAAAGLVEVGAQVTRRPFDFYVTGAVLYLVLTTLSGALFRGAEWRVGRGMRRA